MSTRNNITPITVVRASAGTGKTHFLAKEFCELLISSNGAVRPTELVATTFTNKAAAELVQRVRKFLLSSGNWEHAQSFFASYTGTVNSVCGRLIADLAIESGLAPSLRVIPESQQASVFEAAVEEVLNFYASRIWQIIYRLGKESDWRADVARIVDLARQNDIGAEQLRNFAKSSWATYSELLPNGNEEKISFEARLLTEVAKALASNAAIGHKHRDFEKLAEIKRDWDATGDLQWKSYIRIGKLRLGTSSEDLRKLSSLHSYLPEFQNDIRILLHGAFRCAADCLSLYERFKLERGLLDFIDQERLALSLIQDPLIRSKFENRFSYLLIDEFQDTSPLQLTVFLGLSNLVRRSIWVGDEKQSIYGFRGADPILMQSTVEQLVTTSGGSTHHLSKSHRSRVAIVQFVNDVFIPSMDAIGIKREEVEILDTGRVEDKPFNHPLHFWWLTAPNPGASVKALCHGVAEILRNSREWIVSSENGIRSIKGADIAILCRSNNRRLEVSAELARIGIAASTEREGLLKTEECSLALACLRYLADEYDTLSMAEVVRYTDNNVDSSRWLFDWLDKGSDAIRKSNISIKSLDEMRRKLFGLSPSESLQLTAANPVVVDTVSKWSNVRQRLLNLDALLGLADAYEEFCSTSRHAATVPGLLTYLHAKSTKALQPASPDENAVQIVTYHKAKGLEWPLVILFDLDEPLPATPFNVNLDKDFSKFDPNDPLKGRSIRYWPWPYGKERTGSDLFETAKGSSQMKNAENERQAENLRLLYVGMTRARDYLILAAQKASDGVEWLHMVKDKQGNPLLDLAPFTGMRNILIPPAQGMASCQMITPTNGDQDISPVTPDRFHLLNSGIASDIPYSAAPSALRHSQATEKCTGGVKKSIYLGGRLECTDRTNLLSLGEAIHFFLATDDMNESKNDRLQRASDILSAYALPELNPNQFLASSGRLTSKLEELYSGARWLREWPVTGRVRKQRMTGSVDLLLELSEGYVVIDHKTFPGKRDMWTEMAARYFPQIEAYSTIVQGASGKRVIAAYIHMPVVGILLELDLGSISFREDEAQEGKWTIF